MIEHGTTGHNDSSSVNRMLPFPFTITSCMLFGVDAYVATCFQVIFLKYSIKSNHEHAEGVIIAVFTSYNYVSNIIMLSSQVEKALFFLF